MHALIHHTKPDGSPYSHGDDFITRTLREGKESHVLDECFRRADGTRFHVEYRSYPICRGGIVTGAVVTFFDIIVRLKQESQLRQSQKMEAIGQLAGGVTHDFNNLLIIITGYCDLLLQSMKSDDPSRRRLEEIKKAGERSASLTRQLLAFSRKQMPASKILNLNNVVRDMESLLQESGYTVLEAGSVDEALRVAAPFPARIHLPITDVVMPGKGGGVLAEKMAVLYPKMKVLYLSGYTDDSVNRHGVSRERVDFLQKPFSPLVLARKVREVLSRQLATAG